MIDTPTIDTMTTDAMTIDAIKRPLATRLPLLATGLVAGLAAGALMMASAGLMAAGAEENQCKRDSYPTAVIADYVLACMSANGNSFESLHQCSCSIDFISERMDYETYEKASTVMQVQLDRGQRGLFYRDSKWAKTRVDFLQKVQAESTLRCF